MIARFKVVLLFAILALGTSPAWGVIEALTPLSRIINDSDAIVVAKVEKHDATKSAMLLTADKVLKGEPPKSLVVAIRAEKAEQNKQMHERVAPGVPIVLFITKLDEKSIVLGYTNGTWFQVIGQTDGEQTRWSFTHFEIYLRRTFKGTTAELEEVLEQAIAGKKKPPAPNRKEPAGIGPALSESKEGDKPKESGK